ncbi:hypothetical protein B0H17DRAFT_1142145 [Mycena rosella]|uniref:Uncharacterized protein n=1 Tax=Mycena rosella TaxID=1033263 RepID=A0AAD7G9B8_MYCRO|nr:hypothetical protein B0H17DRAFT_1142145 [Mycena rosella]
MSGLPDVLKIPDGPEKLLIPPTSLPVSSLNPALSNFSCRRNANPLSLQTPPSPWLCNPGCPEAKSILLVHSPAHREKGDHYPLWVATIWSSMERVRDARALWRTAVDQVQETLEKSTTSEAIAGRANAALKARCSPHAPP